MLHLIVNIEIQQDFFPGYPLLKRGIFNVSRQISSQYGTVFTHSQYEKIRKVYTIFICPYPAKAYKNTITRYRTMEENVVGSVHAPEKDYDLTAVVMVCLGSAGDENYRGLLKMLDTLLSDTLDYPEKKQILQEQFDIPMTETMEEEVRTMCNLGQGIAEKSRMETLLTALQNLMESLNLSVDQAMNALKVPEADRPKYRELLG